MDKTSFEAGKTAGVTQEKTSTLMEKAGTAAVSVKDAAVGAGQQVQATALGAFEAAKNATTAKK